MKEITSLNNEYIKFLTKLKDKKVRAIENKFIIEGYHLVAEAYKANILKEALYGPVTPNVQASILQLHKNVTVVATSDALREI